jgi:hypothetical protein
MPRILTLAAAATLAFAPVAASAASIQDDIAACGAMAEEAGVLTAGTYSLRFVDDEGNRNRVLTLKAIMSDGSDAKVVECRMKRSKVLEVVMTEDQKLARR